MGFADMPTASTSSPAGTASPRPASRSSPQSPASRWAAVAKLAMMCDFIIAADSAKFGQPEIKLGVTPGMGGASAWPRDRQGQGDGNVPDRPDDGCGRGRSGGARRPRRPRRQLIAEAMKTAKAIASMSPLAAIANKEMVNAAFETPPCAGHRCSNAGCSTGLFGTEDQKEGMEAFVEKRPGDWKGR